MYGGDDDDVLLGGDGNDMLVGGTGADRMVGGAGDDTVSYSDANYGNLLVDLADARLNVGAAAVGDMYNSIENVRMGGGDDSVYGTDQDNYIYGHGGDDEIWGRAGNDALDGYVGADTIFGGDGWDSVDGGAGNDSIDGGDGNDLIDGGTGNDTMTGGLGNDVFVFANIANNHDVITDFVSGEDLIDLTSFGYADEAAARLVIATGAVTVTELFDGGGATIGAEADFGSGTILTVYTTSTTASASDFIFDAFAIV